MADVIDKLRLADPLVDNTPQPLCPRLRGKGKACLPHLPNLLGHPWSHGTDTHRGEGDGDPPFRNSLHETNQERLYAGVVARAQGEEGYLIVTGITERLLDEPDDLIRVPLPSRPGDHACLTEPAPPRTPPRDLYPQPVVDSLHEGNYRAGCGGNLIEVGDNPPLHPLIPLFERRYTLYGTVVIIGNVKK